MKACGGSGCKAPHILNLVIKCRSEVNFINHRKRDVNEARLLFLDLKISLIIILIITNVVYFWCRTKVLLSTEENDLTLESGSDGRSDRQVFRSSSWCSPVKHTLR
jgi:hypothetical protein